MPMKETTFEAVAEGLRTCARQGRFTPGYWIKHVHSRSNGGYGIFGCAFGVMAWYAGCATLGTKWTVSKLTPKSNEAPDALAQRVKEVFRAIGLTDREIATLGIDANYPYFDLDLKPLYQNRCDHYDHFINRSMVLAEYFINLLNRVQIDPAPRHSTLPTVTRSARSTWSVTPASTPARSSATAALEAL
jgi:hypothetical protein